jgi:hypothetical protein
MITADSAARQIGGVWKMATNADDWRAELDRSVDAVFASFAAFLISAPLVILYTASAKRAAARIPEFSDSFYVSAPLALLVIGDLLTFALDWAASLALLVMLARATGAGKHAADLIVGYNWIQPIITAVQLPAIAVMAATASATTGGLLGIPAFALTLFLIWGVVRRGLGSQPAPTAAIIVMLIVAGAVIDSLGGAVMRMLFAAQS